MTRLLLAGLLVCWAGGQAASGPGVRFRAVDVQTGWGVVYAVRVADINADGRPDIVAINPSQMAWYENPTWQRHVIVDGSAPKDHVTLAAEDVDGDGRVEIALGAGWNPRNTTSGGELFLATRTDPSGREPWTIESLGAEPTLHRIRWATLGPRRALVVTPLHGRGTSPPSWQGIGARIFALAAPSTRGKGWATEIVDDTRHILHNFMVGDFDGQPGDELITASREGLTLMTRSADGTWSTRLLAAGEPGEVALGRVAGHRVFATVEPWHGTSVVAYVETAGAWARAVVDDTIAGGHAVAWADFDGDGDDELVAGWRDKTYGLARYRIGAAGQVRERQLIDAAVAVEDLVIADLDADQRPDIVAGGRATGNIRVFFNEPGACGGPDSERPR
jgi:hypothetical protein